MWTVMDGLLDMRGVKIMARFLSACFLVVHTTLITIFWHCGVTPMVYFNIGSIIFYVLSFPLINTGVLWLYTDLVYLEVVAHMACTILFTGWDSDFQIALVAVIVFAFFSEYLQRFLNVRHVHALPLSLISTIAFCPHVP